MKGKRFLCVLLCVCMIFAACPAAVFAADRCACGYDPVIVVPGYTSSSLYLNRGTPQEQQIWNLTAENTLPVLLKHAPQLAKGIGRVFTGSWDALVKGLGEACAERFETLRMNPDGSSAYLVSVYPDRAEDARMSTLKARGEERYIAEAQISQTIADVVGEDHVFTFTVDWRLGQVDAAKRLDDFIQQVKALTGHRRVNLHSISHGGQLVGFYLFYYGARQDVNNAVLNVPALCGSSIVSDLLYNEGISFDEHTLMRMIQAGFVMEQDFDWLFDLIPLDMLDEPARALIWDALWPILRYCGSVWDLLPASDYRVLRDRYLNPAENAPLLEKLDESHYNVMPHMGEGLRRARDAYGINVSIMASTGSGLATGSQNNSDFIIDTQYTSGAFCADFGERFPNHYAPKASVCADAAHNHISPSMEIDASCAFLPENTWFIEGQFHGMSYWDDYSRSLYLKLLLTDDLPDVRADPAYPQFERSHNPADDLHLQFNSSRSCWLTPADTALIVTNLSREYGLRLRRVVCTGLNLAFNFDREQILAPGESVEIPFTGTVPDVKRLYAPVTVDYAHCGAICLPKTQTFGASVVGGTQDAPDTGTEKVVRPAVYTVLLRLLSALIRSFLPGLHTP